MRATPEEHPVDGGISLRRINFTGRPRRRPDIEAPVISPFPLIFLSMFCGVGGQLALKMGMGQVGQIGATTLGSPAALALRLATTPLIVFGLALYVLGALSWMTVLSRLPLSFAYPFLALGYAVTPFLAWLLLRETVSPIRWLGIIVISLGVFLVSRS